MSETAFAFAPSATAAASSGLGACPMGVAGDAMKWMREMAAAGHLDEASACAEPWSVQAPENRDLRFMRIRLLYWQGDYAGAGALLAREADRDAEAEALRGDFEFAQGRCAEALPRLERAIALEALPENRRALRRKRNTCRSRMGHPAGARLGLVSALEWTWESQDIRGANHSFRLGYDSEREFGLGFSYRGGSRTFPSHRIADAAFSLDGNARLGDIGLESSWEHGSRGTIYPLNGFAVAATAPAWGDTEASLGFVHRRYVDARTSAGRLGVARDIGRFRLSLDAFLGTPGVRSVALRAVFAPKDWFFAGTFAAGKEPSSRPYLQRIAGSTAFASYGLDAAWRISSARATFELRIFGARRQERSFWQDSLGIGLGAWL